MCVCVSRALPMCVCLHQVLSLAILVFVVCGFFTESFCTNVIITQLHESIIFIIILLVVMNNYFSFTFIFGCVHDVVFVFVCRH